MLLLITACRALPLTQPRHFSKEESGGGLILDLGSHILDLLDYLLGPLTAVSGSAARTNPLSPGGAAIEDVVVGSWLHKTDSRVIPGSCSFNFASSYNMDEITIVGADQTIRFSAFTDIPATITSGSAPVWSSEQSVSFKEFGGVMEHVHSPLVGKIVDFLLDRGELGGEVATSETAHRTQVVIDKLLNGRRSWEDEYV